MATNKRELVFAQSAQPGERYYCPACRQPVRLRRGQSRVTHFAHLPGADCAVSEGETGEHLRGKQQLFRYLRAQGLQPCLEVYLPAINQRPDILVKRGRRLVAVEFQCSPLTADRLRARNRGYAQLGIKPVWLLGCPYRHHLSRAKVAQFTQVIAGRPTVPYWNTARSRVEYHRAFRRYSFVSGRPSATGVVRQQVAALARTASTSELVGQLAGQAAATVQQPLAHCPLVCHDLVPSWPVTRVAVIYWRIAVVLALGKQALFTSWSQQRWQHWLWQCGQSYWLTFACAPRTVLATVIDNFTADLLAARVIWRCGDQYVLFCHPRWFPNLAAKDASLAAALTHAPENGEESAEIYTCRSSFEQPPAHGSTSLKRTPVLRGDDSIHS